MSILALCINRIASSALYAVLLYLLPVSAAAEPVVIATTENFGVSCVDDTKCGNNAKLASDALKGLEALERGVNWLKDAGFLVEQSKLERLGDGRRAILAVPKGHRVSCRASAKACHTESENQPGTSSIRISTKELSKLDAAATTLLHKFVHTMQPLRRTHWMNEAMATSVANQWGIENGVNGTGIGTPIHTMDLDFPFYQFPRS
ncbi:MAG: hypothetical protein MJH10_18515, partial [Epibacterium sp.]|nr:hypothetical protein [Epibacterium sp.]NQX75479.1 hypothetical protein [Epibacterium sp.]